MLPDSDLGLQPVHFDYRQYKLIFYDNTQLHGLVADGEKRRYLNRNIE